MKLNSGYNITSGFDYINGNLKESSKGFHIKFSNNVVVSVQFGKFNYCSGRGLIYGPGIEVGKDFDSKRGVPDAEVAILYENILTGEIRWITKYCPAILSLDKEPGGDVVGYIQPDKIPEIMIWARDWVKN